MLWISDPAASEHGCCILTASPLPYVPPAVPGTPQYVDEQFLSRLFLFVALVIMFWLLIA